MHPWPGWTIRCGDDEHTKAPSSLVCTCWSDFFHHRYKFLGPLPRFYNRFCNREKNEAVHRCLLPSLFRWPRWTNNTRAEESLATTANHLWRCNWPRQGNRRTQVLVGVVGSTTNGDIGILANQHAMFCRRGTWYRKRIHCFQKSYQKKCPRCTCSCRCLSSQPRTFAQYLLT